MRGIFDVAASSKLGDCCHDCWRFSFQEICFYTSVNLEACRLSAIFCDVPYNALLTYESLIRTPPYEFGLVTDKFGLVTDNVRFSNSFFHGVMAREGNSSICCPDNSSKQGPATCLEYKRQNQQISLFLQGQGNK